MFPGSGLSQPRYALKRFISRSGQDFRRKVTTSGIERRLRPESADILDVTVCRHVTGMTARKTTTRRSATSTTSSSVSTPSHQTSLPAVRDRKALAIKRKTSFAMQIAMQIAMPRPCHWPSVYADSGAMLTSGLQTEYNCDV